MVKTAVVGKVGPGTNSGSDGSATAVSTASFGALATELARTEGHVGEALGEIRRHRRLARLIVTRDLGFEPSAEVLHAIVRIATTEEMRPELQGIARRFVALSALADRVAIGLLDAPMVDADDLRSGGSLACEVLVAGREAEHLLREGIAETSDDERAYLLEIASCLPDERDDLLTAALVAPHLGRLIEQADGSDPVGDRELNGCRARINAVALGKVLAEDRSSLNASLSAGSHPTGDAGKMIEKARTDLSAYRVIADRLQKRQETALAAGLCEFAGELRRTRCELYALYLSLCGALDRAIEAQGNASA